MIFTCPFYSQALLRKIYLLSFLVMQYLMHFSTKLHFKVLLYYAPCMRFEVLTAVKMKMMFRVVTLRGLVHIYQRFGVIRCFGGLSLRNVCIYASYLNVSCARRGEIQADRTLTLSSRTHTCWPLSPAQ
jgi:hypothetical protein